MSIVLSAVLLGLAAGLVFGGRLGNLSRVPLPNWFLGAVWAGLGLQLMVGLIPQSGWGRPARLGLVLGSYVLIAAALAGLSVLVHRRRLGPAIQAGLALVTIGWLLNFVVIVANGAMPVSRSALESVGRSAESVTSERFTKHVEQSDETHMSALADSLPTFHGGPVISAGDIALAGGIALLLAAGMAPGRRLAGRPGSDAALP